MPSFNTDTISKLINLFYLLFYFDPQVFSTDHFKGTYTSVTGILNVFLYETFPQFFI